MKVIFLNPRQSRSITLNLNSWAKVLLSLCVLGVPLGTGILLGLKSGTGGGGELANALDALAAELASQKEALAQGRTNTGNQLAAYSLKLAEMQARVVRLDALGERITQIAGLDDGEFDFSRPPALGGPEEAQPEPLAPSGVDLFYRELEAQLADRERQLELLKMMMVDGQVKRESTVSGRPVAKGWMSSPYGLRRDPFRGNRAWHSGIDFAGREGSPVIAVAAGIVTRSGPMSGYGELVEIDHGDALVTRYGHNKENLVKVGDLVKKDQVIAHMGSTGRSTGPHVHFEVYKNGRHVDPASYVRRTIR